MKTLKLLILFFFIAGANLKAQTVDLVANVDAIPPLSVGQTFTYTIQAVAGTTPYRVVQLYLEFNETVIQLNSLTPDNTDLNIPLSNDTSVPGVIRYSAGAFNDVFGTTTLFTAVFEVINTTESVMIEHVLYSNAEPNGTGVSNTSAENITGSTNNIIIATLSTNQNDFRDSFSVFPNPVSDVLYIKTNTASEIENITIHSIDGKRIQQINSINTMGNQMAIPVRNLKEALYFVTITSTENEVVTFKVLINQ
ncbi:T9SS type A sorting domain-containing protein [Oceanihabitans sp. 2_MG-2023]|uniref:T9SS type A sorting domain-containing protein n=1 Tax=Oceanihabitans sp. 2_MG-2023 TaxID=3062661 RepID=UPI0026E40E31|nr:T9SS type A sorting domain-containing protein [Oceanihabitans sp. 2_MG-2023]MDO6597660.1 T9SS type A sorting domain-containing protein [Oceanihabitans sp. 2_MG-2023]